MSPECPSNFYLAPGAKNKVYSTLPTHSLAHLFIHSFTHSLIHVLSSRLVLRVQAEENTVCPPGAYSGESGSLVFMEGKYSSGIQGAAEGSSTEVTSKLKLDHARPDREGHLRLEPQVQRGQVLSAV